MAPRSARAPGEVRGWGSAGYSAPPLASSISLPSAGSRPTPGKGPDAGQRFTVPPDSAVRRRPRPALREEWGANQGQPGPRALASWRGRARRLPAPGQLSREDEAARAPPRGGITPAPLCPQPLAAGRSPLPSSRKPAERGGAGGVQGLGGPAASRRSEELTPFSATPASPSLCSRRSPVPAPAPLTQPGRRSAAARRRQRITRERRGERRRGRSVLPQSDRRRHTCR